MATKKKKKGQSKKPNKPSKAQSVQIIEGKVEGAAEAGTGNGMAGVVKAAIILSTFVTIALLSVFSQGPHSTPPSIGVVAIRFSLLSACAIIYFLMLYMTRLSRQKSEQTPADEKK